MKTSVAREFPDALAFLRAGSVDHEELRTAACWRAFRKRHGGKQLLYLFRFGKRIFAWGTSTGSSDRVRRSCMFDPTLTGKYDRRVDYLMLRVVHGQFRAWAFAARGDARSLERSLQTRFRQQHCYRGFPRACCRFAISHSIYEAFKRTLHYRSLDRCHRRGFEEFMREVFFARPPLMNGNGITFKYGDTLEPRFVRVEFGHLERAIAAALRVKFPARRR